MRILSLPATVLATAVVAFPLASSADVDALPLRGKIVVGKGMTMTMEQSTISTIAIPELPEPMKQEMDMSMEMSMEVTADEETAGSKVVTVGYDRVAMSMNNPMAGGVMAFDSDDENAAANPMGAGFMPLLENDLVAVYDKDDNFVEARGLDDLVAANPMMAQFLNEEQFRQMANPASGMGLDGTVRKVGETWQAVQEVNMGGMGAMSVTYACTFVGMEEHDGKPVARIEYTGTMDADVNPLAALAGEDGEAAENAAQLAEGMDMKMTTEKMEGYLLFDNELGTALLMEAETKMKMEMDLAGQKMSVPMDQTVRFTVDNVRDLE